MITPPTNVNALVRHDELMPQLGLPANDCLPYTTICPICAAPHQLSVDHDITNQPHGCWYRCRHCEFRGDSIQLYRQAKSIEDLSQALSSMSEAGLIESSHDLEAQVDAYIDTIQPDAQRIDKLRNQSISNTKDLHIVYTDLLTKYRMYAGINPQHWKWLSSRLGLLTRKNLATAKKTGRIRRIIDLDGEKAPRCTSGDVLTLWYEDAPGRPCAAHIFGQTKKPQIALLHGLDPKAPDVGLAFLGELKLNEDTVIAVTDPLLALHAWSVYAMQPSAVRTPVVVYHPTTTNAWAYVRAERVIFWVEAVTADVINMALRVPNACIAEDSRLSKQTVNTVYSRIREGDAAGMLGRVCRLSRPWEEEVRRQCLKYSKASQLLLNDLKLTAQQQGDVLRTVADSDSHYLRIAGMLQLSISTRQTEIEGHLVEEQDDGYYVIKRGKGKKAPRQRVANVRFGRPTFSRFAGSDTTYCSGKIYAGQNSTTYKVLRQEILQPAKFYAWLESVMLDGGLGVPRVDRAWRGRLYDVACALHPPEVQQVNDTVGYVAERNAFTFPGFTVCSGNIQPATATDMPLPCKALKPGYTVTQGGNKSHDLRTVTSLCSTNVSFWSIFTVAMHNLLAPVGRWQPVSLGLVVDSIDREHESARSLSRTLQLPYETWLPEQPASGMPSRNPEGGGVLTYLSLQSSDRPQVEAWLRKYVASNIMLDVSLKLARGGSLNPQWAFLHCGHTVGKPPTFAAGVYLPSEFLAWYQRQAGEPTGPSLLWIHSCIVEWAASFFPENLKVGKPLSKVPHTLRASAMSKQSYAERFMDVLAGILSDGQTIPSLSEITGPVDFNTLLSELDTAGYPLDRQAIQHELTDCGVLESVEGGYRLKVSEADLKKRGKARNLIAKELEYRDEAPQDPPHE